MKSIAGSMDHKMTSFSSSKKKSPSILKEFRDSGAFGIYKDY